MFDLGHIKRMLARPDALWRHKQVDPFLIHLNQFVPSYFFSPQPRWHGEMWWCKSQFIQNLIRPPNQFVHTEGQFSHGQFFMYDYHIVFILKQWRYNKTIIDNGFGPHIICWTFRQNVCLQVQHIIRCPHHQSMIVLYTAFYTCVFIDAQSYLYWIKKTGI